MSEAKKDLITFLDNVQRTIIARKVSETDTMLKVENPVVVNIIPQTDANGNPNGQMALQLLPLYFKEFLQTKTETIVFNYYKPNIVMIDPFQDGFDFKLYIQYDQIFQVKPLTVPNQQGQPKNIGKEAIPFPSTNNAPAIALFDEEK